MALKSVNVKTKMGPGMKIECSAGRHTLYIDQPTNAGGTDTGPSPLEYYQLALAGCISSIARIVAKQKGIDLKAIVIAVSGELDTDVLLGKSHNTRAGFQSLTMNIKLDSDLSAEQKREFMEEVESRCPVSENTSNTTSVGFVIV